MTTTLLGSEVVPLPNNNNAPGATNVTVPTGTNAVVITVQGYDNTAGLALASLVCSFASLSSIRTYNDSVNIDRNSINAAHSTAAVTATGAQTVTPTWNRSGSGVIQEQGDITLYYYSADDPADFFRDDDGNVSGYPTDPASPATTTSSSATDLVNGWTSEWQAAPGAPSGTTSLGAYGSRDANTQYRLWQVDSPGASSTTSTAGSERFPSQYQVAVKSSAAGGVALSDDSWLTTLERQTNPLNLSVWG